MTPARAARRRARRVRALVTLAFVAVLALAVFLVGVGDGADPDAAAGGTGAAAGAASISLGTPPAASPPEAPPQTGSETPAGSGPVPVSVQVEPRVHGGPVPAGFLGLSFEASALPQIATYSGSGNFVGLLRSLGAGVLRFGGISADSRIAWIDGATPRPAWTSVVLEAGDLRRLGALARSSGWPVLLTVGLAHFDPRAAAREVRVAKRALGPWLAGVEIGNEPDAYARHGLRGQPWNPAHYDYEVRVYRRAMRRLVPGVALVGPGVSGSHSFAQWGRAMVRSVKPALLTGHHYPLGCHQEPPPSIERLLSGEVRFKAGKSLVRYLSVARRARIPFRLDEANTVSCGGSSGISNTFASALWATDYITQAMAAGASGINLQGNPGNCFGYTPVCASSEERLARGELTAQPVWYALLLTKALIGSRPVRTLVSSPGSPDIAVRSLLAPDGTLRFVIVDDDPPGSPSASVALDVGSRYGAASVLALTAPSLRATAGVRLGGRAVAEDGSWNPPPRLPTSPVSGGVATVAVAPSSAALVTLAPLPKGAR